MEGFCGVRCKEKVFEEWGVRQKFLRGKWKVFEEWAVRQKFFLGVKGKEKVFQGWGVRRRFVRGEKRGEERAVGAYRWEKGMLGPWRWSKHGYMKEMSVRGEENYFGAQRIRTKRFNCKFKNLNYCRSRDILQAIP